MGRFLAGFVSASLLWGGFLYAYTQGFININLEPTRPDAGDSVDTVEEDEPQSKDLKRKKKRKKGKKRRYKGESLEGDDLGGPDTRNLDVAQGGGEEQLLGHEIEQGFDSVFSQIRRCLILVAADEPVTGKLTFGLRISGAGRVTKVNLRGPSAITKTEAGSCLRKAARAIKFRTFNGPDMLVHYPITLD